MRIDMERFRETFFAEAVEHLNTLESCLLRLETEPGDRGLLDAIFRSAHSLKGASGTFGFADVARFTHVLESLLDRVRDGTVPVTRGLTDQLLRACDVLAKLVDAAKAGGPPPAEADAVAGELQAALDAGAPRAPAPTPRAHAAPAPSAAPEPADAYRIRFAPGIDLFRRGIDPLHVLTDLTRIGKLSAVRIDASRLPRLEHLDPESCYLAWTMCLAGPRSKQEIENVFCFVADDSDVRVEEDAPAATAAPQPAAAPSSVVTPQPAAAAQPTSGPQSVPAPRPAPPDEPARPAVTVGGERRVDRSSIRVPVDKVDRLVNLVEELVVTQSMLNQSSRHLPRKTLGALKEAIGAMDRNLRDLQERVMAIRMVPIASVTGRFPRLVRELSATLGKPIRFETRGDDTELDKQVIEQIGDPLLHLIRNAADHGVDTPEERRRAGKPEEGVIRLTAAQRGDCVHIEVADDGRGLDLTRIRAKAVANGLIGADDVLSDDEVRGLIFRPGFSTAEAVTDLSGRGVGMDVVKKNIEALRGSVMISSEFGRGTRIRIKLPLTVAIIDGLCLGVGDEVFIVPLLSVVESMRLRPGDVRVVAGRGSAVVVRGETLPVWSLGSLMGHGAPAARGLVVIVEGDGRRYGLLVDALLGQSQVVIKTLEANYRKVVGVTGATILGDGRVAMILDVHGLPQLAGRKARAEADAAEAVLA